MAVLDDGDPLIDAGQRDRVHSLVTASGTGSCHGGESADVEAFTETRWTTLRGDLPTHPS